MTAPNMPAAAADATSVGRFLAEHLGGVVEMGPGLAQGEWSHAYAFRHAGRHLVIRFNPERHSFDMEQMAERYRSDDLPIPKVIEVGEVDGGFFAISERVFGEFLEELSPESMRIRQSCAGSTPCGRPTRRILAASEPGTRRAMGITPHGASA